MLNASGRKSSPARTAACAVFKKVSESSFVKYAAELLVPDDAAPCHARIQLTVNLFMKSEDGDGKQNIIIAWSYRSRELLCQLAHTDVMIIESRLLVKTREWDAIIFDWMTLVSLKLVN